METLSFPGRFVQPASKKAKALSENLACAGDVPVQLCDRGQDCGSLPKNLKRAGDFYAQRIAGQILGLGQKPPEYGFAGKQGMKQ